MIRHSATFVPQSTLKPDFANAAYNAGWTAEQMGDMDQACGLLQKAYEAKPTKDFLNAFVAVQKRLVSLKEH